ncbi:MAG TPA: hypothetical protein PLV06_13325 [Bacteroidales bacterium]|nr:hypothetical protein [Bacteroidales bacterium]HPR13362.1 hypothetical protein [Bacteroidales bacterium]HRW85161.1 hypothetical protein [Bacteroidales bacterium]
MRTTIPELKLCGFIITLILTVLPLNGQQDSTALKQHSPDSAGTVHSLFSGAAVGYNMMYMGSSISGDKPYYSGGLTYGFRNELYFSAYTYHLNTFDPVISFSTFSLVYAHTFNTWFDISLSASRYQVNKDLTDTLFTSFFYGDLTLGFDWRILYTKLSAGALFAESNGFYLQIKNSRYFETPSFLKNNAYFSFDPGVNLLFGTLTETSEGMVVRPPYSSGRQGGGSSSTSTNTSFSLLEIDFGLPISFNIGKFTIDAEPGYALPVYKDAPPETKGFVFSLSVFFRIL